MINVYLRCILYTNSRNLVSSTVHLLMLRSASVLMMAGIISYNSVICYNITTAIVFELICYYCIFIITTSSLWYSNCFLTLVYNTPLARSKKIRCDWIWMGHIRLWYMLIINTIKQKTENLINPSREGGLEINTENYVYLYFSSPECREKS
jgi:hypothetical protein